MLSVLLFSYALSCIVNYFYTRLLINAELNRDSDYQFGAIDIFSLFLCIFVPIISIYMYYTEVKEVSLNITSFVKTIFFIKKDK